MHAALTYIDMFVNYLDLSKEDSETKSTLRYCIELLSANMRETGADNV